MLPLEKHFSLLWADDQTEFGYRLPHFLPRKFQSMGLNNISAQAGGRFDKVENKTEEKRVRHEMVDTDKCSKQRK